MSDDIPTELGKLADDLKRLTPRRALPGRDRIMFEAGRRSARASRVWPLVSGALAAMLFASLAHTPPADVRGPQEVAVIPAPEDPPLAMDIRQSAPAPAGYLRTRNEVLRWGVDVLPAVRTVDVQSNRILTPLDVRRAREEV